MPRDSKTFEVDGPVDYVFRRWADLQDLKNWAPELKEVRRNSDDTAEFVTEINGQRFDWIADISVRERDHTIVWRSVSGLPNNGQARFEPAGPGRTRITVDYEYELFGDPNADIEEVPEMVKTAGEGR